ncbi:hypothetical protein MNBD_PLANCTO03-47 [hydrothermal vent metagenome]|uniref:Uncharacterized protein n=1 Tax=hydrothermal vent metagenome TaxID=652676 RepID=A0A3B1DXH7_9ZZZZ
MTAPGGDSDRLASLLTGLLGSLEPAEVLPEFAHEGIDPLIDLLLYSFLLWESTPEQAATARANLHETVIDANELRVSMPDEIQAWIGLRDRVAAERAKRLRASLNAIFHREHTVTLQGLIVVSKREVRDYLDSLEGMTPFVAARVTLFGFQGHAIPADRKLCSLLSREQVLKPGLLPEDAERWLERQIRASDAEQIVRVLEAWRETPHHRTPPPKAPEVKSTPAESAPKDTPAPPTECSKKDS